MNIDDKIKQARKLMFEVDKERKEKIKSDSDNMICRCGHKHKEHTSSLSINYTAGFCSKCDCEHFVSN